MAARPSSASAVSYPSKARLRLSASRTAGSSSTIRMRAGASPLSPGLMVFHLAGVGVLGVPGTGLRLPGVVRPVRRFLASHGREAVGRNRPACVAARVPAGGGYLGFAGGRLPVGDQRAVGGAGGDTGGVQGGAEEDVHDAHIPSVR